MKEVLDEDKVSHMAIVEHMGFEHVDIDKKVLIDYLKQSEQEIVWTVLGEKQRIGGMGLRDFPGRSEFSYSYYWDNEQIKMNHEVFHVCKAWQQGT